MKESAILFGKSKSLVGIITEPDLTPKLKDLPAVIILNSGLVHHVGLNRLHVRIARQLALIGFITFRFDFSGIGDSQVRLDHLPFNKSSVIETQEAMDHINEEKGINQFILTGICSGAVISYNTAICDNRVAGIILINPIQHLHGHDEKLGNYFRRKTLSKHYKRIILRSSFRTKNWKKAITGKIVDYKTIIKTMIGFPVKTIFSGNTRKLMQKNSPLAEIKKLNDRGVKLYLIHSEADEGLDYLQVVLGEQLQDLVRKKAIKFEIILGANHTFTLRWSQEHLQSSIRNWLQEMFITKIDRVIVKSCVWKN